MLFTQKTSFLVFEYEDTFSLLYQNIKRAEAQPPPVFKETTAI